MNREEQKGKKRPSILGMVSIKIRFDSEKTNHNNHHRVNKERKERERSIVYSIAGLYKALHNSSSFLLIV